MSHDPTGRPLPAQQHERLNQPLHGLLHELLRDDSLYHRAPPDLRARVMARLAGDARRDDLPPQADQADPADPARQPRRTRWLRWLRWPQWQRPQWQPSRPLQQWPRGTPWLRPAIGPALPWAGGGLAGLAASALLFALLAPVPARHDERLGQEIVASHVRALLSQHPVDVVSTDQHTVKPWFNGRLDYAPPVVDLATRGFPLAGGRMDYVAHRRVAVLVYRDQRHPIDLYVLPAAEGACTPANRSADGYAMVRWCAAGMDFWAISDAEPAHVRAFAQALRDAVGDPRE